MSEQTLAPEQELVVGDSMISRVQEMRDARDNDSLYLRITVEGGGCSGFHYVFDWDDQLNGEEDQVFAGAVITDTISLPIMSGAKVDFVRDIMGEHIHIDNPNAQSGCGCGTSFSI